MTVKYAVIRYVRGNRDMCTLVYGPIEWWDTSEVTDMTLVFFGKNNSFDISNWNVCNVTDI